MNIPGWEKCNPTDPQAQLVNGEWWRPAFGCDSLQMALDHLQKQKEMSNKESAELRAACSAMEGITSTADLCQWLRANSSGAYRPAAMAASEIESQLCWIDNLQQSLDEAAEDIDQWGSYASDFHQQKYDLKGTVANHENLAAKARTWLRAKGFTRMPPLQAAIARAMLKATL